MSKSVKQSTFTIHRWVMLLIVTLLALSFAQPAEARRRPPSYSKKKPSNKPAAPSLQTRLLQAQQLVKSSWIELSYARERLADSQQEYDRVVEELRVEGENDPTLRDAATTLKEARAVMEQQRAKALAKLAADPGYIRLKREQTQAAIRLEALDQSRQESAIRSLPVDDATEKEIAVISVTTLRLNDELSTLERQALDDHEGFQAARKAMDLALKGASDARTASIELRTSNLRRQTAHAEMQAAYEAVAVSNGKYAQAKVQLQQLSSATTRNQKPVRRRR